MTELQKDYRFEVWFSEEKPVELGCCFEVVSGVYASVGDNYEDPNVHIKHKCDVYKK